MTVCDTMRERLLEAELSELQGEADTPLGQHVKECERCRALARRIVDGEQALARTLDAVRPNVDLTGLTGRYSRSIARRRWWRLVPLVAAAGIGAVLVLRGGAPASGDPAVVFEAPSPAPPLVETFTGQNITIFNTRDPDIVVVWFYGGEAE